jgi:hypothetical protein
MAATKIEEPQMAAKESSVVVDDAHLKELRDAAEAELERRVAKDTKVAERLDRRHAVRDGEEAVAVQADVRVKETERRKEQEEAHKAAQERAAQWIAPDPVKGRMKDVELILHPEEKVRKMTIQIRVLGEVPDGYVMIFEEPFDKYDLKQGRIAESPRFGTKNRVRVADVDPETGKTKGEITHPGYFDFGPLRMNPGKYRAVVVDTDDDVLAEETFEIVPDWDEDGQSDQVVGVHAGTKKAGQIGEPKKGEAARAAKGQEQVAREAAKAAGTEVPPAPGDGSAPKLTAEEKQARKDSPEGRAK